MFNGYKRVGPTRADISVSILISLKTDVYGLALTVLSQAEEGLLVLSTVSLVADLCCSFLSKKHLHLQFWLHQKEWQKIQIQFLTELTCTWQVHYLTYKTVNLHVEGCIVTNAGSVWGRQCRLYNADSLLSHRMQGDLWKGMRLGAILPQQIFRMNLE